MNPSHARDADTPSPFTRAEYLEAVEHYLTDSRIPLTVREMAATNVALCLRDTLASLRRAVPQAKAVTP